MGSTQQKKIASKFLATSVENGDLHAAAANNYPKRQCNSFLRQLGASCFSAHDYLRGLANGFSTKCAPRTAEAIAAVGNNPVSLCACNFDVVANLSSSEAHVHRVYFRCVLFFAPRPWFPFPDGLSRRRCNQPLVSQPDEEPVFHSPPVDSKTATLWRKRCSHGVFL